MHEIKKNIPLPTDPVGRPPTYPFGTMAAGDCFDTDLKDGETLAEGLMRMRSSASTWRSRHNSSMSFVVRVVESDDMVYMRVWAREGQAPKRRVAVDEFGLPKVE